MGIGNFFVAVFLTYYTVYIIDVLFNRTRRKGIQQTNNKLDELRNVPIKSLEEQRTFVNLKYPKRRKWKWSWMMIPKTLWRIVVFVFFIRLYLYGLSYFNLDLQLWHGIIFIVIFPFIINMVLGKFKLQKGDLSTLFRGGNKK